MAQNDGEYSYKAQKLFDQIIVDIKPSAEQQMAARDYVSWVLELDDLELDEQTPAIIARRDELLGRIEKYTDAFYQENDCFPNDTRWKRCRVGDSIVESEEP